MKNLKLDVSTLMPLRDVVYKTLRDAILKGELKPGTRLMEIHLAEKLGVSRTPVREAIRMLENEGLAVTYPRRGAQVAHMSVKDLEDVIAIREALDVLAATCACENANDDTISRLSKEIEAFESSVEGDNHRDIVEADESFHNIIYEIAGNQKLTEIVNNLREQMYRYRYEYIKDKTVVEKPLNEHKMILKAIKKRDKQEVTRIMKEHLANQYENLKQQILREEQNKSE